MRVYVRSPRGWQTSPNVTATATPRAGIPASSLAVGTLIRTTFDGAPYNHILVHKTGSYAAICPADRKIGGIAFDNSNIPRWKTASSRTYANGSYKNRFDAKTQAEMLLSNIATYFNGSLEYSSDYIYFMSNKEVGCANEPGENVSYDYFKIPDNRKIPFNGVIGDSGQNRTQYILRTSWASTQASYPQNINVVNVPYPVSYMGIAANDTNVLRSFLLLFNISPNTAFNPIPNADGSYNLL